MIQTPLEAAWTKIEHRERAYGDMKLNAYWAENPRRFSERQVLPPYRRASRIPRGKNPVIRPWCWKMFGDRTISMECRHKAGVAHHSTRSPSHDHWNSSSPSSKLNYHLGNIESDVLVCQIFYSYISTVWWTTLPRMIARRAATHNMLSCPTDFADNLSRMSVKPLEVTSSSYATDHDIELFLLYPVTTNIPCSGSTVRKRYNVLVGSGLNAEQEMHNRTQTSPCTTPPWHPFVWT